MEIKIKKEVEGFVTVPEIGSIDHGAYRIIGENLLKVWVFNGSATITLFEVKNNCLSTYEMEHAKEISADEFDTMLANAITFIQSCTR